MGARVGACVTCVTCVVRVDGARDTTEAMRNDAKCNWISVL